MRPLLWIKKEIVHVFPVFLFFFFFFVLINWTEAYLFEGSQLRAFHLTEVALTAALIAKIILVVDHWELIHRFRSYPLAYGILWKTLFYWVILFLVRLLIRFVPFAYHGGDHFDLDFERFIHAVPWNIFLSIQVYYLMLLFIFITFQELTFKIGVDKMRQLFFGK